MYSRSTAREEKKDFAMPRSFLSHAGATGRASLSLLVLAMLIVGTFGSHASAFAAAPQITSLSTARQTRSGLLTITGAGFGAARASSRVEIGGVPAHISRWMDTEIKAYVAETSPRGLTDIRVVVNGVASNSMPFTVTLRPAPNGRIKWRFTVDADYVAHRAAVGTDGTVYVNDVRGHLYALAPNGGLKWIFQAGFGGALGPVSLGQDGTIYVASSSAKGGAIYAVNPDGTRKWLFDNANGLIIAGPSVGPDGNIYAVAEIPGIGLFSLTPAGRLRYARDQFGEQGPHGEEIVFGAPGQLYFGFNSYLYGYRLDGTRRFAVPAAQGETQLQPVVGANGTVYVHTFPSNVGLGLGAFSPAGSRRWNFYEFPGNTQTHPDVGADKTIYMGRNLQNLLAINPDRSVKWRYVEPNNILFHPIASPDNRLILMGGRVDYGQPGFIRAVDTAGSPLWRLDLPDVRAFAPYGQVVPSSRARFAPNGQTAYLAADILGDSRPNEYAFFYAIDTR
jgi:outer membrane protein assembly factor BamB